MISRSSGSPNDQAICRCETLQVVVMVVVVEVRREATIGSSGRGVVGRVGCAASKIRQAWRRGGLEVGRERLRHRRQKRRHRWEVIAIGPRDYVRQWICGLGARRLKWVYFKITTSLVLRSCPKRAAWLRVCTRPFCCQNFAARHPDEPDSSWQRLLAPASPLV